MALANTATRSIAVLDTNIWLDWLVFRDPCVQTFVQAKQEGLLQLPVQARIRDELIDVVKRPIFEKTLAKFQQTTADILFQFDLLANLHDPAPACVSLICHDRNDQMFLDLAVACQADFLVSKDKQVLKLAKRAKRLHNLVIFSPSLMSTEQRIATLLKC